MKWLMNLFGLRLRRVVRRCINRVKFLMLYRFMLSVSHDARSPHYNFACGTIKGYKWRMFVDSECWIGINDNTSKGPKWPAFYSKHEILEWIKNNQQWRTTEQGNGSGVAICVSDSEPVTRCQAMNAATITEGFMREEILKLCHGDYYEVPESDYGKAEIWRIHEAYLLFEIPLYGGTPRFVSGYSKHQIDEMIKVINSWT